MNRALRLERALDALSRERKHVQRDLGEVVARRARLTRAMDCLQKCRDAVGNAPMLNSEGEFVRDYYLVARSAEARMTEELGYLESRLAVFDQEITHPVKERLRVAAVHERAVETLLKRRREAARRVEAQNETRQMDEYAHHGWRRKQAK